VVEFAAGNAEGALSAYEVAIKLGPDQAENYLGRAEVLLAMGHTSRAADDLRKALAAKGPDRQKIKAKSMLEALRTNR